MMNESCYRLLVFRYILVIAVGCYMANTNCAINKKISIVSYIIGAIFILGESYIGYKPKIITYWAGTSFIACLYVIPLVMFLIKKIENVKVGLLEILGKASYNIFLIQMIWYTFGSEVIKSLGFSRSIHLCINIVVCLSVGVIFYMIEMPLTKGIIKRFGAGQRVQGDRG